MSSTFTIPSGSIHDNPCDPNREAVNGSGITIWNRNSPSTIQPGATLDLTFTCPIPRCYNGYDDNGKDTCNVVFSAKTTQNFAAPVTLDWQINNGDSSSSNISGSANAYMLQAWELANAQGYNDISKNTFHFTNNGGSTIVIPQVKIIRTYFTCGLYADQIGACTFDTSGPCWAASVPTNTGNMDPGLDKPYNYQSGGGLSYSTVADTQCIGHTLSSGQSFTWIFDFSSFCGGNYVGKSICLFNINQVDKIGEDANHLELAPVLNGQTLTPYYNFSRFNGYYGSSNYGAFPTIDLAASDEYHETSPNTLTLLNNGPGALYFETEDAGVNIYRIYRTKKVYLITVSSGSGGTISPGSKGVNEGDTPTFIIDPDIGCNVEDVKINNVSIGPVSSYTFSPVTSNQSISATFSCAPCLPCYVCVACNECNVACMACYASCEVGCEVSCEVGCEVSCEVGCEVSCEVGCEVSCQVGCEICVSCEGNYLCPPGYYECSGCVTCQPCVSCMTACELGCLTCQTTCEYACQVGCELCVTCQGIETCPWGYYVCPYCESCQTCQPAYT